MEQLPAVNELTARQKLLERKDIHLCPPRRDYRRILTAPA